MSGGSDHSLLDGFRCPVTEPDDIGSAYGDLPVDQHRAASLVFSRLLVVVGGMVGHDLVR